MTSNEFCSQTLPYIEEFGCRMHPLSIAEIADKTDELLAANVRNIYLAAVNHNQIVAAQRDSQLLNFINNAAIANIDNMRLYLALKLYGYKVPERAATPDIFERMLQNAQRRGHSVYFLGATDTTLQKMLGRICYEYPQLKIAGSHNGYFQQIEMEIVKEIKNKSPDYLFIALPSPQKEQFILNHLEELNCGVCYGVGGAFDAKAGVTPRAPVLLRKIGLEGYCRILYRPKCGLERFIHAVIPFYGLFFRNWLRKHRIHNAILTDRDL